jgi:hypothetical protein
VADGWCWFVLREEYCWLVAGGWFIVIEKYCWLVADKPSEQGVYLSFISTTHAWDPHVIPSPIFFTLPEPLPTGSMRAEAMLPLSIRRRRQWGIGEGRGGGPAAEASPRR